MPINDSSDQLDLIGFLVLNYLIMKEIIIQSVMLIVIALLFCLVLSPFWNIGFNKIFSISMVLSLFYNKGYILKKNKS